MDKKYAKDQAAGFTNRIERVAIVGFNGQLGKFITRELLKNKGNQQITALTRGQNNATVPEGIKIIAVDYDNEDSLVDALKDQQFLIITLSVRAPPDTQPKLITAAAKAGVRYIMPNFYGTDLLDEKLMNESPLGSASGSIQEQFSKPGDKETSYIALVCGLWYEYSLAMGPIWFGFDFPNKLLTLYDDGNIRTNVTTWIQCARAIAKLCSLSELPYDENDESPTVSRWANKPLYISSFLVSQRDMFQSWKRVSGDTDADWTIESESSENRYKRGLEQMKNGSDQWSVRMGAAMSTFVRTFYPNGGGNYQSKRGLANDILGLPTEDFDESTRVAAKMVEDEYAAKLFASRPEFSKE